MRFRPRGEEIQWGTLRFDAPGRYRVFTEHCHSEPVELGIYPGTGTRVPQIPTAEEEVVLSAFATARDVCPSLETTIDEPGFYRIHIRNAGEEPLLRDSPSNFDVRATPSTIR